MTPRNGRAGGGDLPPRPLDFLVTLGSVSARTRLPARLGQQGGNRGVHRPRAGSVPASPPPGSATPTDNSKKRGGWKNGRPSRGSGGRGAERAFVRATLLSAARFPRSPALAGDNKRRG